MSNAAGAGAGNGQGGSGAPSGGSPEGGSENEGLDDKFEKRIKAALANQARQYESRIDAVRAEFEAFKAGASSNEPPADKPRVYTRAELKAAVDAAQITQEQADDRWAAQIEAEATSKAVAAATAVVNGQATKERVDSEIESYKRLKPEIMEKGSELRGKVEAEFDHLVHVVGMPGKGNGVLQTQLAAIRAVLGPLDKLEKSANAGRAHESDEQGGGTGGGKPGGGSKKLVDHLKGDAKEHYERGIKQGRYKDWNAVEAELKYASPSVRQRLGLPQAA